MGSKLVKSNFLHIFGVRKKIKKKKKFQEKLVFIGKIGDFSPIFFFSDFSIPISFPAPPKSDFTPKNRPKSAIFLSMVDSNTMDKKIADLSRFFGEKSDFGGAGKDIVMEKSGKKKSAKNRRFF